ncbi:hypothetical protein [Amycolatopsis pretoriensis]|uniref:hypothetical protein n=1 Tax=Amycolatopsis pretoriensis TaxID=218821 RepID=UPI000A35F623|nr:hypothetical protein [Amycolatopsis pretoriensis]
MRKSVWLWILVVVVVIVVLGLIFGGYRKGEKLGAPSDQPVAQVDVTPSALPVPWKPNSVAWPAATLPL